MSYYDRISGDQYSSDETPPYVPIRKIPMEQNAFYENQFRADQYAIPSALTCGNPNPYIQDDIRKSQRHQPPRAQNIYTRSNEIAETSLEPGLSGPNECARANGQKMYYSRAPCGTDVGMLCGCASHNGGHASGKEGFTSGGMPALDMTSLLMVFIFIVLIFMCVFMVRNVSEVTRGGIDTFVDRLF